MTKEELEKKVEEHCNKAVCSRCGIPSEGEATCHAKCHDWQDEYDAFQQGMESGYGVAVEEAKNIVIRLIEVLAVIDGEQTKELKEVKEAEQFLREVDR